MSGAFFRPLDYVVMCRQKGLEMKLESYSISKPIKGICKSYGIWGNQKGMTAPLVYFTRPKWIEKDEDWEKIISAIKLDLPENTIIGT